MSVVPVADVLQGRVAVDQEVTVRGWVRTRRDSKAGISFLAVYDGSCFDPVQAVINNSLPNYNDDVLHPGGLIHPKKHDLVHIPELYTETLPERYCSRGQYMPQQMLPDLQKIPEQNAHRFSERLPPGGQYAPADRYRHEHHRDCPVLRLPEPQLLCGNLPAAQRLYPQPLPYAAGRGI